MSRSPLCCLRNTEQSTTANQATLSDTQKQPGPSTTPNTLAAANLQQHSPDML